MPIYEYKAYDKGRNLIQDQITADDEKSVRALIREQGLFPYEIRAISGGFSPTHLLSSVTNSVKKTIQDIKVIQERLAEDDVLRLFEYTGQVASSGETIRSDIQAVDIKSARQLIRERGHYPLTIKQKRLTIQERGGFSQITLQLLDLIFPPKINLKELALFIRQLATMLESGLPLLKALDLGAKNVRDSRLKFAILDVKDKISEGVTFSQAIREHQNVFPPTFIELIHAGDVGGNMQDNLIRLADFLERQIELRNKVKAAMTYPVIVLSLVSLIVLVMVVFVVPQFVPLFEEFKLKLPLPTRILIAFSNITTSYWWSFPLIVVFGIWVYRVTYRIPVVRTIYQQILTKIPLVGPLLYKATITRIIHTIAITMTAGISIRETLLSMHRTIDNGQIQLRLDDIRIGVERGGQLSTLFVESRLFPEVVNNLVNIGEETGNTDVMLERAAFYLDQEVDLAVKQLLAAMEPFMTMLMGAVVFFLVGSLYLPIFSLIMNSSQIIRR